MQLMADFIREYCVASDVTEQFYRDNFVALPCSCEDIEGIHWASIHRSGQSICDHLAFHSPTRQELMMLSQTEIRAYLKASQAADVGEGG